jgi:hypothetical protein
MISDHLKSKVNDEQQRQSVESEQPFQLFDVRGEWSRKKRKSQEKFNASSLDCREWMMKKKAKMKVTRRTKAKKRKERTTTNRLS